MSLEAMSTPAQDTRDKVIRLEVEMHAMRNEVAKMSAKVDELHELLTQARGARWMLMILIALGGFMAAKIVPLVSYFIPSR